jgi:hypothetical protein
MSRATSVENGLRVVIKACPQDVLNGVSKTRISGWCSSLRRPTHDIPGQDPHGRYARSSPRPGHDSDSDSDSTPCSARSPCIALREAGYDLPDGLPVHLVTERPIVSYAARFLWSVSNPRRWMNEIEVD